MSQQLNPETKVEPEHKGSFWSHPYVLYMGITAVLFVFVLLIGWLFWSQGWVASPTGG